MAVTTTTKWSLVITLKLVDVENAPDEYTTRTLSFDLSAEPEETYVNSVVDTLVTMLITNGDSEVGFIDQQDTTRKLTVKQNQLFQPSTWNDVAIEEDQASVGTNSTPLTCTDIKTEVIMRMVDNYREWAA